MVWKFNRPNEYVSQYLLGSYSIKMFQVCLRVSRPTFTYCCHLLGLILSKKYSKFRHCIPIDVKISIILYQLGSSDTLHIHVDLYGISSPNASIIVRNIVRIKKLLGLLVSQRPTLGNMKKLTAEFQSLHRIPYILGH